VANKDVHQAIAGNINSYYGNWRVKLGDFILGPCWDTSVQ
jgi:hypothetical protein